MGIFLFILFIVLIIILSAIFSGSEAALLSVSYPKVKEILNNSKSKNKKKQAKKLIHIKDNIQNYLTTLVVLNNIVNIIGSIYVGVFAANLFGELYLGIISGVLTFLIIIFSEIIPKVFAEQRSESISLKISGFLIIVTTIFSPIIYILNKITYFFVKKSNNNFVSEGEIREMAFLGTEEGSIKSYESDIIRNVFRMDDTEVYDIMVPKNEVITIQNHTLFEEIVKIVENSGHTRFPILEDDEIVGIINVKDLFKYHKREDKFQISKILRPVIYAPETMKLSTLETKLKKERTHMAVIVNEFGDFVGIVTLEDIIEEIIGEIEDEFDLPEKKKLVEKIAENKYHIDGGYDIEDLNDEFELGIDNLEEEEFHTINGFFTNELGRIGKVNDKISVEKGTLRVILASKKQISKVELILE